ncbi:MAG: C4-dicarboxylic acid transporter DauA [Granulosicoccaceae bacterium]|jgi:SulP family sulfate permease
MFRAAIEAFQKECTPASFRANILAGVTVGIIALPLSMALAIAVGVAPQHGLYTAIFAGIIIALTGGSKVNISGPTAAFVVVLLPITQQYGMGGLLISGFLAGIILVLMGVLRLGRFIEIVPYPVIVGFTSGIGVVIATLQIKDFFGLEIESLEGHYLDKLVTIFQSLPSARLPEFLVAAITLVVLIVWPRLKSRIPGHLVALLLGSFVAFLINHLDPDLTIATIGSRFHYEIDGILGSGIPPMLPAFEWPWNLPDSTGKPIGFSFDLLSVLLASAITIAALGAIESLLCAVVADGMSGKKHYSNDELIGQGIGNIIIPFFGGIPATAAIARTAASIRAGGSSPLSSVVHGLFILLAILFLAPLLAYIPMASLAALLLIVAWNMSEAGHFIRVIRIAPRDDVVTLLICFSLTVLFDMTIAVSVGMVLAAVLFVRRSITLFEGKMTESEHEIAAELGKKIVIYDINGPLFFGSAQKAMRNITSISPEVRVVVLDMTEVNMIDMTALVAMESIAKDLLANKVGLVINNLKPRMLLKLRRAGIRSKPGQVRFARSLDEALEKAESML